MAAPSRHDMKIYQGETWTVSMQILDINEDPVDFTGYTAGFAIRNRPGDPDSHVVLTSGSGITIDAPNGKISLALTPAQTSVLAFSQAAYDLYVKAAGGTVTYLLYGDIELIPRVAVAP